MIGALSVVVAALVLMVLFRPIFGSKEGFYECLKYWLKPDIISWFRGEHLEDAWAELKLFLWIGTAGLSAYGVHALFS